jgi:hypothetical protein
VLSSFDTLEPTEWGLKYNSVTKKLASDDVYEGGLYLLNPLNSFIVFPSTLRLTSSQTIAGPRAQL